MIFALFLAAGLTIFLAVFLEPVASVIQATRWQRVPCTIVASRVEKLDKIRNAHTPEVHFVYRFGNATYRSSRIWFIRPTSDTLRDAQQAITPYPKGLETFCYVDPNDPAYAVLQRGFKPELLIALVPLALILIGAYGLASTLGPILFTPSRLRRWVVFRRLGLFRPGKRRRVHTPAGDTTIRPHHKSKTMPFFISFALLWNGLMFFLVREVIDLWREGIPDFYGWSLTLFATPMVLIGLAALIPPIYLIVRWFNPRPMLTLSSKTISPGGELSIRWRFWGSTRRIQRLRLFLEGREESTCARGPETLTECDVFSILTLLDTTDPDRIRAGQLKLSIAADAPPTLRSDPKAVVWSLRVHGDNGKWPDIDEEVELIVSAEAMTSNAPPG